MLQNIHTTFGDQIDVTEMVKVLKKIISIFTKLDYQYKKFTLF